MTPDQIPPPNICMEHCHDPFERSTRGLWLILNSFAKSKFKILKNRHKKCPVFDPPPPPKIFSATKNFINDRP